LLESLLYMRAGWPRKALDSLQELLGLAPHNRAAMWLGALAYAGNDEQGKAIDLLNQGVHDGGGPAFLAWRAHYYTQKRLYEKAQRDLLAVVGATPVARDAELDLADLFQRRGWSIDRCRRLAIAAGKWPDSARVLREYGNCLSGLGYTD